MLTVADALREVLERARPLPATSVPLADALGCVLAENVAADIDLPPFDKALVDGYAVRAADLASGTGRLEVGEEITAGRTASRSIGPREAAVIMTGAPLPEGADAVVMIERTRRVGNEVVVEGPAVVPGQNRLARGRESRAGEVVLRSGERLNSPRLGLLASIGRTSVAVVQRPLVAVLTTGDELVEPDQVPGPGQIRNSNASLLGAMTRNAGGCVEILPTARDENGPLRIALARGLGSDVLLVSGGVSAGSRDLVPSVLDSLGVCCIFHKVAVKPGKPLWFGVGPTRAGGRPGPLVFGLPGNPVSGIVGFLLFVRPALDGLAGHAVGDLTTPAQLVRPYSHSGDRPTYHPATFLDIEDGIPRVDPLPWAGSADLKTVARADGFILFPAGDRLHAAGEIVRVLPLG